MGREGERMQMKEWLSDERCVARLLEHLLSTFVVQSMVFVQ